MGFLPSPGCTLFNTISALLLALLLLLTRFVANRSTIALASLDRLYAYHDIKQQSCVQCSPSFHVPLVPLLFPMFLHFLLFLCSRPGPMFSLVLTFLSAFSVSPLSSAFPLHLFPVVTTELRPVHEDLETCPSFKKVYCMCISISWNAFHNFHSS